MKYSELPDTITPENYMEWRGVGRDKAYKKFRSKGFPIIRGMGNKLIADKRNVLLFELELAEDERQEVIREIARQII